ncbi:hypothetical protein CBR_g52345 [Chara braunii]|uniref:Uncharacterized protein n=1 Tax=Chara braunii TaxID=69332 RepID=A0A388K733_CHABU|nr:hypothetical protein CBR_g52345 [Chara braunii]|eukprot:GBG65753.1 hypothetical protein CBR_g52345 [Chara braunii]
MQVTPMGFTNAVAEAQRRMLAVAGDMLPEKCEPYIDDNPIKSAQEKDETEVQPGIRRKPNPAKTDKISQWPTPLRMTSEFDYKIERIAGIRNKADGLSRVCITPEGVEEAKPIDAFLEYEGGTLAVDNEMMGEECASGELLIRTLEKGALAVAAELREGPVTTRGRKEEKDSWGAIVGPKEELIAMAIEGGRDAVMSLVEFWERKELRWMTPRKGAIGHGHHCGVIDNSTSCRRRPLQSWACCNRWTPYNTILRPQEHQRFVGAESYGRTWTSRRMRFIGVIGDAPHDAFRAYKDRHGRPLRSKTSDVAFTSMVKASMSWARKKAGAATLAPHVYHRSGSSTREGPEDKEITADGGALEDRGVVRTGASGDTLRRSDHVYQVHQASRVASVDGGSDGQGAEPGGKRHGSALIVHDDGSDVQAGETTSVDNAGDSDFVPAFRTADEGDGGG